LKYYEAGMDLGLSEDPYKSYELFQGRILDEYEKMIDEFKLTVVNATKPLLEQQEKVQETVKPHLETALRTEQSAWKEVLTQESLQGRYLE
jgi:dTMP kinase